ncbi:MAG TPA: ATP phosphoribosyltransferase [Nannocystaceae bacterium]|nr:ATP phosphoribosyltransferase [Nannocystaceae bacterium]
MAEPLTIALPKGRILATAARLLARAGLALEPVLRADDRRLLVELPDGNRVLLVKPIDVPTYVEHGVADLGVAGADTLEEQARDLYEPVDLGIGACRLVVAEARDRPARPSSRPAGPVRRGMAVRVATKYPRLTRRHYIAKGIEPEIIPLWGSVELAAVTDLADQIVDLVESGETLRQNGLTEVETIMRVTSRLIVHPASLKLGPARIAAVIDAVRAACAPLEPTRTAEAS